MEEVVSGQRVARFSPAPIDYDTNGAKLPRTAAAILMEQQSRNPPRNQNLNPVNSTIIASKDKKAIPMKRVLDMTQTPQQNDRALETSETQRIEEIDSSSGTDGNDRDIKRLAAGKSFAARNHSPVPKRPRKSVDSGYAEAEPSHVDLEGEESRSNVSRSLGRSSSVIREKDFKLDFQSSNGDSGLLPLRIYRDESDDVHQWSIGKLRDELGQYTEQHLQIMEELDEIHMNGGGRSALGHDIGYLQHTRTYVTGHRAQLKALVEQAAIAAQSLQQTSTSPRPAGVPTFSPRLSAPEIPSLNMIRDTTASTSKLKSSSAIKSPQVGILDAAKRGRKAMANMTPQAVTTSTYFGSTDRVSKKSTPPIVLSSSNLRPQQELEHLVSPPPAQSTSRPDKNQSIDKKGKGRAMEVDTDGLGEIELSDYEESVKSAEEDEELLPIRADRVQRRFVPDPPPRQILPSRHSPPIVAPIPLPRAKVLPVKVPPQTLVVVAKINSVERAELDPARICTKPKMSHPWSRDVSKVLRQRFGLAGFRKNQEDAINATLAGKDVFVLLPTGGGKSLCFQLPAVVQSGTTKGVTIVVSPLLSLISDQCMSLRDKDIPVIFINGLMPAADRSFAMSVLKADPPRTHLAYVTPELIANSGQFGGILKSLYDRHQLARFVIDEAHCVSSWGHDFRPDYKQMSCLKKDYPGIPLIALTATANERVKKDVLENLGMQKALVFSQSFNRPNLKYEVRPKTKKVIEDIAQFIMTNHNGQCGIIYCNSKAKCEDTAAKLQKEYKIRARHYHAGLNKDDRARIQTGWQNGEFTVICATIAFGMGIDKADVRYVIHFTLSASLEAYYQETGRAGRDGKPSVCVLFFQYADTKSITHLIDQGEGTYVQKQYNKDNLRNVVQYCLNLTDCRRTQVLAYFGEKFAKEKCHNTCDNCSRGDAFDDQDVTVIAQKAVQLVQAIEMNKGVTGPLCVSILKGSRMKKILDSGYDQLEWHGAASSMELGDVERLYQLLNAKEILGERFETVGAGHTHAYMTTGRKVRDLFNGSSLTLAISKRNKGTKMNSLKAVVESVEEEEDYEDENGDAYEPDEEEELKESVIEGDSQESKCLIELLRLRKISATEAKTKPSAIVRDEVLQVAATTFPKSVTEWTAIDPGNDDTAEWYLEHAKAVCLRYAALVGPPTASKTFKKSAPVPASKARLISQKSSIKSPIKRALKPKANAQSKANAQLNLDKFAFVPTVIKAMPMKKK